MSLLNLETQAVHKLKYLLQGANYKVVKIKSLKIFAIVGLSLIVFLLSIALNQPSNATVREYQSLINQGLIDNIRSPHELGLDYLQQEPIQLADSSFLDSIRMAYDSLAIFPEDIPYKFDLGTNYPIQVGRLQDREGQVTSSLYEALGYVDNSGTRKSLDPRFLKTMFATEYRSGGNIVMKPEAQHILVADARKQSRQISRTPTINLLVRDKRTNLISVLPNVNANAVCRDALNAVLNDTLRRRT